ncbi:MAG: galactosyltransferase-related protein [Terracoccus sp.]
MMRPGKGDARRRPLGRLAVVTIVAGRHRHLQGHLAALARSARRPDLHVVVAMGDPEIAGLVGDGPLAHDGVEVVTRDLEPPGDGELPLAAARNVGADVAIRRGCDLLVFLDVDCLVSTDALDRYERAWRRTRGRRGGPVLLSGPVSYLPPLPSGEGTYPTTGLASLARPHAARPAPRPGRLARADDLRLFWSLSFAVAAQQWDDIGGFSTGYRGYGGEDTDFAMRVAAAGGVLFWVGGADAFHQHHEVESPPLRHLASIVRNANHFHERWGWFPMEGWLGAFERLGLAKRDPVSNRWILLQRDEPAVVADVLVEHPVD